MKKLIVLILCLCMSLSFVACTETNAETEDFSKRIKRAYIVDGNTMLKDSKEEIIFVDSQTGVMYLFIDWGYGGGLTVMVDENGDPLIWEDSEVAK